MLREFWHRLISTKPQRNPKDEGLNPHEESHDDLLGSWGNWAGDDSGLAAIWGFGIEFKQDGVGVFFHYATDIPKEEEESSFMWERISDTQIRIKVSQEDESEWEELEYELKEHQGGYGQIFDALTRKGTHNFWCSHQPLYRSKKRT